MDAEEWMSEVAAAYGAAGREFSAQARAHLLLRQSSDRPKEAMETAGDVVSVMTRAILARAARGESFGLLGKAGGHMTYADGSRSRALDLIAALQSFRVELADIEADDPVLLHVALSMADEYVSKTLMSPPPAGTPAEAWREKQRKVLADRAPEMDADGFLADLRRFHERPKVRSGRILLAVLVVIVVVVGVILALRR